jgi:hypothetical protein
VAISLVGTPQTNTSASTNSFALNVPAGVVAGDVLIGWICRSSTTNDVAATGWTKDTFQSNGSGGVTLLYRVADGSEGASVTFAWNVAGGVAGVMIAYRGVDGAVWDTVRTGTSHGTVFSIVLPSVTTTVAHAWYLAGYLQSAQAASGQFTPPGTLTERADVGNNNATNKAYVGADDGDFATAGATGTQTVTAVSNAPSGSIVGALRPAVVASVSQLALAGVG